MKSGQMIESKFLKKDDVGEGKLLTIRNIKQHNVAMQGADPEMKWCAEFDEIDKPLVLNSTNIHLIEAALGTDDTDDWMDKQIVCYNDENVSFGGKVVGGVRVDVNRTKKFHAKNRGAVEPKPEGSKLSEPRKTLQELEDDIPF